MQIGQPGRFSGRGRAGQPVSGRHALAFLVLLLATAPALLRCSGENGRPAAGDRFITVASTTSARNSGLFDHILPLFTATTGIEVRVIAVGTGQAILLAERGDADVLLVHHRPSEERFVATGHGLERRGVMLNNFVLIGPASDPAGIGGAGTTIVALERIAAARAVFVSRGDDSGTHRRERTLWREAGIDVVATSGSWYREAGAGMGATLNIAAGLQAYTLADSATWLNFANKDNLTVLFEGDPRLVNPYGVILVNPRRHPHVKAADGQAFVNWLTSPAGQEAIASYEIHGTHVFFPNAAPASPDR